MLMIARMRAEAEEAYSTRLADIVPTADKISGGFSRDEGATIRKVCTLCRLALSLSCQLLTGEVWVGLGIRWHDDRNAGGRS